MADREVNGTVTEVPDMPEVLEKVLLYALNEGRQKMEASEEVIPFTALVVKEDVFIETHPADSSAECFDLAQHTVEGARGATAYAFCYDGYIETDDGTRDALIAEGGIPGDDIGHAIGLLYTAEDFEGADAGAAGAAAGADAGAAGAVAAAGDGAENSTQQAYTFDESPAYIGEAPNFMSNLKDATEYTYDDIDERYKDDTFAAVDVVGSQAAVDVASSEMAADVAGVEAATDAQAATVEVAEPAAVEKTEATADTDATC